VQSESCLGICPESALTGAIYSVAYSASEYRKILKGVSTVSEQGARIEWSTAPPPKMIYHDNGDWRTEVRTHAPFLSNRKIGLLT